MNRTCRRKHSNLEDRCRWDEHSLRKAAVTLVHDNSSFQTKEDKEFNTIIDAWNNGNQTFCNIKTAPTDKSFPKFPSEITLWWMLASIVPVGSWYKKFKIIFVSIKYWNFRMLLSACRTCPKSNLQSYHHSTQTIWGTRFDNGYDLIRQRCR